MADFFSRTGAIGAIFLVSLMMVCTLVPFVITLAAVYGMNKGLGGLQKLFDKLQGLMGRVSSATHRAMDRAGGTVIEANARATGARQLVVSAGRNAAELLQNLKGGNNSG